MAAIATTVRSTGNKTQRLGCCVITLYNPYSEVEALKRAFVTFSPTF